MQILDINISVFTKGVSLNNNPYQQPPSGSYPSNPGYPPQGQPGPYPSYPPQGQPGPYPPYPPQPGYPPPGYPQQPPVQQQPAKKKPEFLKIGCGVLVAIVVLMIIIGVVSGGKSNTGTAVTTSDSTATNNVNTESTQHFQVGDTVKVGDTWQVVVNSVKTDLGGQYSILKQGDVYLLIDVSLTNISNKEQVTSSMVDWKLTGSDGQAYSTSFFSGAPSAPDGKVEAGSPAKGTLTYEVPASIKEFRLAFAPSLFSAGQTIWDLSVS